MKSIQDLAAEHLTAERMLCLLECIAGRIEAGQAVDPNDPSAIIEFFQIYCERSHYAKEERKLFVAIESAGLRDYRETIADLIRDHSQSRHLVGNMGTAARRFSTGEVAAGQEFAAMAHEYVALMRGHIRREEETLFRWLRQSVSRAGPELSRCVRPHGCTRIGPRSRGRHRRAAGQVGGGLPGLDVRRPWVTGYERQDRERADLARSLFRPHDLPNAGASWQPDYYIYMINKL
jgi:hemerythrin-like domain-containing protein